MIDFRRASFLKSAARRSDFLTDRPQLVFLGRSNVGKSSLINAVCGNSHLMYVSRTPGRTQLLNYLDLEGRYYLVDAPGYGYASGSANNFESMMLDYFRTVTRVAPVLLTDSRRPFTDDDRAVIGLLSSFGLNPTVILTKADKLNQSGRAQALAAVRKFSPQGEFVFASVSDAASLNGVRNLLARRLQSL